MSSPTDAINGLSPLNATVGASSPDAEREKIQAMAQQFESLLLAQMMREMKQSMAPESDEHGLGGAIMGDTFMSELGLALSRAGGVGFSKVLVEGFTKQLPVNVTPEATAAIEATAAKSDVGQVGQAGSAERQRREDGRADQPPLKLRRSAEALAQAEAHRVPSASEGGQRGVSSEFGWRTDPIDGRHRFHAGTDLRLAYGQEVRAAAAGSVSFAGEQGGYGTTVIVRHADGVETRYAHLSSLDVRAGDQVAAGQILARSGNSGRTTGPHLHFEVRQHGRPVDPEAVEGLASLEELGGDAGH